MNGVTPETIAIVGDDEKTHLVPKTEVEEHYNSNLILLYLLSIPLSALIHYTYYKTFKEQKQVTKQSTKFNYICYECGKQHILRQDIKYCALCKKCMEGYVCHCAGTGNCLGDANHKYNIQWQYYITLFLLCGGLMWTSIPVADNQPGNWPVHNFDAIFKKIDYEPKLTMYRFIGILILIFSFVMFWFAFCLHLTALAPIPDNFKHFRQSQRV